MQAAITCSGEGGVLQYRYVILGYEHINTFFALLLFWQGATMTDDAAVDPTTLPWRGQLPHLLFASQDEDYEQCSHLCRSFLDKYGGADGTTITQAPPSSDDEAADAQPPPDVVATVRTTYVRSLLQSENFEAAVEHCRSYRQSQSGKAANLAGAKFYLRQEEAYAHYRLQNYGKAREVCRSALISAGFDANDLTQPVDNDEAIPLGLVHVYAQSLHRLNETVMAGNVYEYLQHRLQGDGGAAVGADADEAGEALTNALAVRAANATYAASAQPVFSSDDEDIIQQHITPTDGEFNYDLCRNYALVRLVQSTSASEVHRCIQLLQQAEEQARDMLQGDGYTEAEIAEEVAPIVLDVAAAQQMLGDRQSASRAYLSAISAAGNGADASARFVARHNLAVLTSATNAKAAEKQMPTAEEMGAARLLSAAQIRTVLYNRALLALANDKHDECRYALEALRSAMAASGGKKNKKKGGKDGGNPWREVTLSAPPANAVDGALWSSRVALLESEVLRAAGKEGEASETLQSAMEALEKVESELKADDDGNSKISALQFAMAALALHRLEVQRRSEDNRAKDGSESKIEADDPIDILSNLPPTMKNRPAILGALSAMYSAAGDEAKVTEIIDMLSNGGGDGGSSDVESARIRSAQYVKSGRYEDAVEVLRSALESDDVSEETHLELTARLVQALSLVNPEEAEELAASLDSREHSSLPDGETLERKETPRLGKSNITISRKAANGESQEKREKRDAALRRRAKKREAYLAKLESEGRYNPDKPSKPDPERWIPKAQRSYSRRGRRGRQRFVGAQGGGTGAGADRDAAKLDAAARAAAKRDGTYYNSSAPSTAHMNVASGGTSGRRKGRR